MTATGWISETWDRVVGSDPGLQRLRNALSAAVAMSTALGLEYAYGQVADRGPQGTLIAMLLGTHHRHDGINGSGRRQHGLAEGPHRRVLPGGDRRRHGHRRPRRQPHHDHARGVRGGDVRRRVHPPVRFAVLLLRLHVLARLFLRRVPSCLHRPAARHALRDRARHRVGAAADDDGAAHPPPAHLGQGPPGLRRQGPRRWPGSARTCSRPTPATRAGMPGCGASCTRASCGWPRPRWSSRAGRATPAHCRPAGRRPPYAATPWTRTWRSTRWPPPPTRWRAPTPGTSRRRPTRGGPVRQRCSRGAATRHSSAGTTARRAGRPARACGAGAGFAAGTVSAAAKTWTTGRRPTGPPGAGGSWRR